jgi:hypothetical protein
MNIGSSKARLNSVRNSRTIDLRRVAEYHAAGVELQKSPAEAQRLIRLAINEAEALAQETGLPELVLPSLAEEKVRSIKRWAERQELLRRRSQEWSLSA